MWTSAKSKTNMARTLNMTQGKPMKLLFLFALPLMGGNVFQQLYTVVDTAIVGRGVGLDALAALGTVDWLNLMMLGLAQGFTQGFSVRISQKYGEGDLPRLKQIVAQSAVLTVLIALCGAVLSQLCLPLFLRMLRVPPQLQGMAALYTRILFGGFPAVMFFNYCSAVLRAVGDSKTPLMAMSAAAVSNIILDAVAVFWLGWGIAGAAAATVAAQILSGIICVWRILKTPELHFSRSLLKPDAALCADLARLGAPMAIKNVIIALGGMVIQTVVNGFTMSFIAGFTATNKLYGLLEIAALSYGYAVTTYVGQNYGAGNYSRIRCGMKAAVVLSLSTAAVIAGLMVGFGRPITLLFISAEDAALVAAAGQTAYHYLCVMSAALPVLYLLYVYQAALQGMGNSVVPMLSGIIEFALRLGGAALIAFTGYQNGIFGAEVSAWIGAAVFLGIHYYRSVKRMEQTQS